MMMPFAVRQYPRALPFLVHRRGSMPKHSIYMVTGPGHKPYIGRTSLSLHNRFKAHKTHSVWCSSDSEIQEIDTAETLEAIKWLEWWHVWFLGLENTENLAIPGTLSDKQRAAVLARGKAMAGEGNPFYGKTHTDETKTQIGRVQHLRFQDPKEREKVSEQVQSLPYKQCPHCGKYSQPGNYGRWHGDNCGKEHPFYVDLRSEQGRKGALLAQDIYEFWKSKRVGRGKILEEFQVSKQVAIKLLALFKDGYVPANDPDWVEYRRINS